MDLNRRYFKYTERCKLIKLQDANQCYYGKKRAKTIRKNKKERVKTIRKERKGKETDPINLRTLPVSSLMGEMVSKFQKGVPSFL